MMDLSPLCAAYRAPPRCYRCHGTRTHPCGQRRGETRRAPLVEAMAEADRGQRKLHFLETAPPARQRSPRRYHSNMVVGRRCRRGHKPHTSPCHRDTPITDHAHRPATVVQSNPGIGTGQGPSLEWGGSDTTTGGAKKLSEALEEADIERKKAVEEAERRAKW